MRLMTIAAMALLVASCATDKGWHWQRAGATQQQFNMDDGQCRAQAYAGTGGYINIGTAMILHSCMEGKGWQKVANQ